MEVKKLIRKVAALSAGATMVGATLFSAVAADLGAFPAPFVKDGVFDALIVVGDKAMSEDVVGAVDIGASMQFELRKETPVSTGGSDVFISSGIKIKGTGSEVLNYDELIGDVRTSAMDDIDMPVTLAEGRYTESEGDNDNDETYTQTIMLTDLAGTAANGLALHDQPDDGYDMDDYLELYDGDVLFTYELEFDDAIDYDNAGDAEAGDDLEGTTLEVQGNLYTITNVKLTGALGTIDEITMMAGETLLWLTQDQVITKTVAGVTHEIKVVDVTDEEDACGVSVDGDMVWIDSPGGSKDINGVKIGILDAKAVHAQLQDVDVCEINVGATEIVLTDGDRLERDGEEVRDAQVTINDGGAGDWTGFAIEMTPDDDIFLAKDDEWVDPSLSSIKFIMGGVTTPREDIKLERKGSKDAELSFTNNDGKLVEVPLEIDPNNDDVIYWGKTDEKPVMFETDSFDCDTGDVENCDGTMLFAVTSGGTAHVIEISDIDATDETIDLQDLTYGRTWSDKALVDVVGGVSTIDLGSLGEIQIAVNDGTGITATMLADGVWGVGEAETSNGANIVLANGVLSWDSGGQPDGAAATVAATVTEDDLDDGDIIGLGAAAVTMSVLYDSGVGGDEEIEVSTNAAVLAQLAEVYGSNDKVDGNSDIEVYATQHGTLIESDEDDESYVLIQYPSEEVEVQAFVAPVSAQISTSGGAVSTITLPKLNVGAARLASEISDYKAQNLIVVGGPCADKVAADVMGTPFAAAGCEAGFTEGKAIVKMYDTGSGKVAMVVAGMSAMDTRRATRVVANFASYKDKFVGTEVVVSGTSLSDISVSAPQ